jgi:hypothetical protein
MAIDFEPIDDKKSSIDLEPIDQQQVAQPQQHGIFHPKNIGERGLVDILAGLAQMGHGVVNAPSSIANQLAKYGAISSEHAQMIPRQQDYDYAKLLGISNSNLADQAVQIAAQYSPAIIGSAITTAPKIIGEGLPLAARAMNSLSRMLSSSAPFASEGATQDKNPTAGYMEGLGGVVGGELLGKGIGATAGKILKPIPDVASSLFGKMKPKKQFANILQNLGQNKGIEEIGQEIADNVKNSGDYSAHINSTMYKPVERIMSGKTMFPNNYYENISNDIIKDYLPDVRKIHKSFIENPTYENAHDLQSELGFAQRTFDVPNATPAERAAYQNYRNMRKALLSDMKESMDSTQKGLSNMYMGAAKDFYENVTPYYSRSDLAKIMEGKITNPRNIPNSFRNPEENTMKVASESGIKNKILYSELNKSSYKDFSNLSKALEKLDEKGLSSYVEPDLTARLEQLSKAIKLRKYGITGLGAVGLGAVGGGLGHHLLGGL